jgi:hypothetical protein
MPPLESPRTPSGSSITASASSARPQGVSLTFGHHSAAILTFIPASGIILPMETTQVIQDIQATPDLLDRALKLSDQLKQEVERELTLQD